MSLGRRGVAGSREEKQRAYENDMNGHARQYGKRPVHLDSVLGRASKHQPLLSSLFFVFVREPTMGSDIELAQKEALKVSHP